MTLPQFPNFFFGTAKVAGEPAAKGWLVTAVIGYGRTDERRFTLPIHRNGYWGWANNGPKLKVGGVGADIADRARISFFISAEELGPSPDLIEAGHDHFYADQMPHITRMALCQD